MQCSGCSNYSGCNDSKAQSRVGCWGLLSLCRRIGHPVVFGRLPLLQNRSAEQEFERQQQLGRIRLHISLAVLRKKVSLLSEQFTEQEMSLECHLLVNVSVPGK